MRLKIVKFILNSVYCRGEAPTVLKHSCLSFVRLSMRVAGKIIDLVLQMVFSKKWMLWMTTELWARCCHRMAAPILIIVNLWIASLKGLQRTRVWFRQRFKLIHRNVLACYWTVGPPTWKTSTNKNIRLLTSSSDWGGFSHAIIYWLYRNKNYEKCFLM